MDFPVINWIAECNDKTESKDLYGIMDWGDSNVVMTKQLFGTNHLKLLTNDIMESLHECETY